MAARRIIALAGLPDGDVAQLRALVARAAEVLDASWAVGDQEHADLLVLEAAATEGMIAQARAVADNSLWVAIDDDSDDSGLLLSRPFELDGVMQLLVSASERLPAARGLAADVIGGSQQFGYGRLDIVPTAGSGLSLQDFLADDLVGRIPDARPGASVAFELPAQGVDRDDPLLAAIAALASSPQAPPTPAAALPAAVPNRVATSPAASAPAAGASPTAGQQQPASSAAQPSASVPAVAAAVAGQRAHYPLIEYLEGKLLGLPSRIVIEGAPPLVIDPIASCFHASGPLSRLEPYLDTPLARTHWSAMLQSQLAAVRRDVPGRPFDLLRWHQAFRSQAAGLATTLDPGGLYSLHATLDLAADHPRAARIAAAMVVPRRLAEIASMSATSVSDVFAVVSAFAAIGYLDQHARPRPAAPRTSSRG
jgi:hypothetical protein